MNLAQLARSETLSYTEEQYPILRRYHIGEHPLLRDQRKKNLEPTAKFKSVVKEWFLRVNVVDGARDGLDGATVRRYQTKEVLKGLEQKVDIFYARQFMKWLQGRSIFNQLPWTKWGTQNLLHVPGVVEYLKEATAMRHDYLVKLNMLAKFGPQTLRECELYFKYIILHFGLVFEKGPNGEEQYVLLDGMLEFLDDFSEAAATGRNGGQPYSQPYRPDRDPEAHLLQELQRAAPLMPMAQVRQMPAQLDPMVVQDIRPVSPREVRQMFEFLGQQFRAFQERNLQSAREQERWRMEMVAQGFRQYDALTQDLVLRSNERLRVQEELEDLRAERAELQRAPVPMDVVQQAAGAAPAPDVAVAAAPQVDLEPLRNELAAMRTQLTQLAKQSQRALPAPQPARAAVPEATVVELVSRELALREQSAVSGANRAELAALFNEQMRSEFRQMLVDAAKERDEFGRMFKSMFAEKSRMINTHLLALEGVRDQAAQNQLALANVRTQLEQFSTNETTQHAQELLAFRRTLAIEASNHAEQLKLEFNGAKQLLLKGVEDAQNSTALSLQTIGNTTREFAEALGRLNSTQQQMLTLGAPPEAPSPSTAIVPYNQQMAEAINVHSDAILAQSERRVQELLASHELAMETRMAETIRALAAERAAAENGQVVLYSRQTQALADVETMAYNSITDIRAQLQDLRGMADGLGTALLGPIEEAQLRIEGAGSSALALMGPMNAAGAELQSIQQRVAFANQTIAQTLNNTQRAFNDQLQLLSEGNHQLAHIGTNLAALATVERMMLTAVPDELLDQATSMELSAAFVPYPDNREGMNSRNEFFSIPDQVLNLALSYEGVDPARAITFPGEPPVEYRNFFGFDPIHMNNLIASMPAIVDMLGSIGGLTGGAPNEEDRAEMDNLVRQLEEWMEPLRSEVTEHMLFKLSGNAHSDLNKIHSLLTLYSRAYMGRLAAADVYPGQQPDYGGYLIDYGESGEPTGSFLANVFQLPTIIQCFGWLRRQEKAVETLEMAAAFNSMYQGLYILASHNANALEQYQARMLAGARARQRRHEE